MEQSKASTSAQQPVWDFAKFAAVMIAFFFYAVVDAIITIIWQAAVPIVIAVIQVIAFLAIECLLYFLYLRGIRRYIITTNVVIGLMGVGGLVNLVQAGVSIGQHAAGSSSVNLAEPAFFILAALANLAAVTIHFIIQNTAGRSTEYKPIDMEQLESQDDEAPAIVNPPEPEPEPEAQTAVDPPEPADAPGSVEPQMEDA
jgi:hypothetical protein